MYNSHSMSRRMSHASTMEESPAHAPTAVGCQNLSKCCVLAGHMSHQPHQAYQPPVIYQQNSPYSPGSFPGSQPYGTGSGNPQSGYAPAPVNTAGWMGPPPASQPNPYTQQPYQSQQPFQQPQQQQPYGQQQPYQQQAAPTAQAHDRANQLSSHSQQPPAQYLPPTTYQPNPAPSGGRKKALLVGCCYPGTSAALNGCINDVQCVEYCLKHRFGFQQPGCIVVSHCLCSGLSS